LRCPVTGLRLSSCWTEGWRLSAGPGGQYCCGCGQWFHGNRCFRGLASSVAASGWDPSACQGLHLVRLLAVARPRPSWAGCYCCNRDDLRTTVRSGNLTCICGGQGAGWRRAACLGRRRCGRTLRLHQGDRGRYCCLPDLGLMAAVVHSLAWLVAAADRRPRDGHQLQVTISAGSPHVLNALERDRNVSCLPMPAWCCRGARGYAAAAGTRAASSSSCWQGGGQRGYLGHLQGCRFG